MSQLYGLRSGQKIGNLDLFIFQDGYSYSSFHNFDMNFLNLPVYRADTKEEFLFDAGTLVFTIATGGWTKAGKFVLSQLEQD